MSLRELKAALQAEQQGRVHRYSTVEVESLIEKARGTIADAAAGRAPASDAAAAMALMNDLYKEGFPGNGPRAEFEPNGFTELQAFVSSRPDPIPVTPRPPSVSPAAPVTTVAKGPLELYGPAVAAAGLPQFLQGPSPAVLRALFDFGGGNGLNGTGVHLGGGRLLTARHVAFQWMGDRGVALTHDRFVGAHPFQLRTGWTVRVMPEAGSVTPSRRVSARPEDFGTWNDWALVQASPNDFAEAVTTARSTRTLRPGEPVWVVGDGTGGRLRVTVGRVGEVRGSNIRLEQIAIEGGFSGSPAFDANGRLVGIAVVKRGDDQAELVAWDAIDRVLRETGTPSLSTN